MSVDEWELYYWPLAGRGEFVRIIFEEAGVKFKDISDVPTLKDGITGGERTDIYPTFAPPMIKKGTCISFKMDKIPEGPCLILCLLCPGQEIQNNNRNSSALSGKIQCCFLVVCLLMFTNF